MTKGIFQSLCKFVYNANVKADEVNNEGIFESSNNINVGLHCSVNVHVTKRKNHITPVFIANGEVGRD